ncbi:MAG: nitrate reductase cytochrome c-type subunit [Proteobacteria bacterium]|nr:nitrate reductase cytochrome c-type subunit [Pseudomonadota bacterium]
MQALWRPMRLVVFLLLAAAAPLAVQAQSKGAPPPPVVDSMRGSTPVDKESSPPILYSTENKDVRRTRNYAMQPPTIPHSIDNYQVDKDFNRCMFCHARTAAEAAKSIPVSITHYMDRDNNVLADVSPRRYFCTQCHVPQADAKPLVGNNFVDVEQLLQRKPGVMGSSK